MILHDLALCSVLGGYQLFGLSSIGVMKPSINRIQALSLRGDMTELPGVVRRSNDSLNRNNSRNTKHGGISNSSVKDDNNTTSNSSKLIRIIMAITIVREES